MALFEPRGRPVAGQFPSIQSTDETPVGPLELRVYPGPLCRGSIYLDDGHTFRYQQGEFLRQGFMCQADSNSVRVNIGARQGNFAPWWKTLEIVIYDWPSKAADAKLSNGTSTLKTSYDSASHALHVLVPDTAGECELNIGGRQSQ